MTYVSNIPREELAPAAPPSPEEAVPDELLRLLAYGDAEAMAEAAGSMQIAEMAGELLAYRLSARAKTGPRPNWGETFVNTLTGRA